MPTLLNGLLAIQGFRFVAAAAAAGPTWTYQGCYLDDVSNRTFSHRANTNDSTQSVEQCTASCADDGYDWAGLEYAAECYCDYQLPAAATQEPNTDCSMPCSGNSSEVCGSSNRLSVYSTGSPGPVTNSGPDGWSFLGCYTDSQGSRTLRDSQTVGGGTGMTVAACTSACGKAGYVLAGVEFGKECWCDHAVQNAGTLVSGRCDTLCSGNSSEFCGGSDRIDVYQTSSDSPPMTDPGATPSGWTALGCFTDDPSARTLVNQKDVAGGFGNMTVEACLDVCGSSGFVYGGVEYAGECWCGNQVSNNGTCATDPTSCYQPCQGNEAETCGGPVRLNIYYSGSDQAIAACSSDTPSTSSPMTPTTSLSATTFSTVSTSSLLTITTTTISTFTSTSESTPTSSLPTLTSSASTSTAPTSSMSTSTSPASTLCPTFWGSIISDLAPSMRDTAGCTDLARAAIRYAFHDSACYSSKTPFYSPAAGGADGSLLLSATEINRTDNNGLHNYHDTLTQKFAAYKAAGYPVSAADLIQVAGSLGVLACPGGRIGRVYVGRSDTTVEPPMGLLPNAFGPGSDHDTLFALFADKGFSARDLAALIGAHTTAIARAEAVDGIPVGTPLDTTPGSWDVLYYNQTLFPPASGGMARFDSDINLSKNATSAVGKQFKSFVGNQPGWGASFSSAWQALTLLGVPASVREGMQDCTTAVVGAFPG